MGHKKYRIFSGEEELCCVNKSLFKKEISVDEQGYSFPGVLRRSISELELSFPLWSLLWRRRVKSYCVSNNQRKLMLAVAITILVWLTWNALPAD